ncbi:MAG TPA: DUF3108 domain-containing protein [Rhodanobacter sp.]
MKTSLLRAGLAMALALPAAAVSAASVPQSFTATYHVLQGGQPLGDATLTLKPAGNGQYEYTDRIVGTAGLAAALGASTSETSRFAWVGKVPQAISYKYAMASAFKPKRRELAVQGGTVQVDDNGRRHSYAAQAGMVERNTLPLALGVALRDGAKGATFPVGGRQAIEMQTFKVAAAEKVSVPAGSFDAVRVDRTDQDRDFNAWYVPAKYPVPVKLAQKDGGNLTLELVSYSQP